jgi:membrane protease YdiL (CAAX protease family)
VNARPQWWRIAGWSTFVVALGALGAASHNAKEKPNELPIFFQWSFGVGAVVQYALTVGILLAIAIGLPPREVFALRRPRSWPRALGIGVAILVGIYVLGAVVARFIDPGEAQGIVPKHWVGGHAGAFAFSLVAVAVVAPVVEELMFRGLGFYLLRPLGEWPAIVLVGIAFGVAHGLYAGFVLLAPFGAALAYLRSRSDSVYPGMFVHGLFNLVAVLGSVFLGSN